MEHTVGSHGKLRTNLYKPGIRTIKSEHCVSSNKMNPTIVCLLALTAVASAATLHLEKPIEATLFGQSRIINGVEASPGEFPHQVTLLRNGYHMCGGSVIANGWVLTAAHCVDGQTIGDLAVVVDLHSFSNPGNSYIWFDISQVIMHPNYNQGPGGFPNDVAVLRLDPQNPNDITKNIIDVYNSEESLDNVNCVISGWGVTESGSGSAVLMKATVRALPNSECATHWGNNILSQHLCVLGESTAQGSGSCNGDSGGPVVCNGFLAGATSWGRSGCHVDGTVTHPSVYARTSFFYSWINTSCGGCLN